MPRGVAEPTTPNPLRNPPAPELPRRRPGRPRKDELAAAPGPAEAPPVAAKPGKRELPSDPTALEAALASARVQFQPITELVGQLCAVLPPELPLAQTERDALTDAGARVLYVHGADIDPLWGLALCLAAIAIPRYLVYRHQARQPKAAPAPEKAAA